MKFSAQLPTNHVAGGAAFTSASAISEMAQNCEAAGFDAGWVTEHPFPSVAWISAGGHHALDPFVSLAIAAAATERLRLHTNIVVLPYRNPFLMAKAIASLDVVSAGRVILGVAAGYLEDEYDALGADFANRNEVSDDALAAMKQAWQGKRVERGGPGYRARGNAMLPRPVQRPHPPIWVGGNSKRAMRRAAEHAQGWSPFPAPAKLREQTRTAALETTQDLADGIERLNELAAAAGRADPLDVNFVPFGRHMNHAAPLDADALCEQILRLEALGVSWLTIGMPVASAEAYAEGVAEFGERVIARLAR